MKRITTISAALLLAALPALAQEEESNDLQEGAELLSEGTRLLLRGLLEQLEPAAEGWDKLIEMLNDLTLFHPPEVLPNGDIIIRRKLPVEPESDGATDL